MRALLVPKTCERCERSRPAGLSTFHPSGGASMGKDAASYGRVRWFAWGFFCIPCHYLVQRRGLRDRWVRAQGIRLIRVLP